MTLQVLIISGHYRKEGEGVTIELFGRCPDGRSVTALYRGFKPYFYMVEPDPAVRSELRSDPNVISLTDRKLWYLGMDRDCLRVEIRYPFDVPRYRDRFKDGRTTFLAADIPFIYRFFYDRDLSSYTEIEGTEREREGYTTDIVLDITAIRSVEPFKVKLKVLSFDIENSIRTNELFMVGHCTGWLPFEGEEGLRKGHIVAPMDMDDRREREDLIIQGLEEVIAKEDPDVITGYNVDGYDIPFLLRRCTELSVPALRFGRDGSTIEDHGFRSWRVKGRIIVDAWWEAKKTFRPKKETLEAVSRLLLGEGKDDIDTSIMDEEWANRRDDVILYCEKDSELALRILDRTRSVKRGMDLSYVAKLPLLDVLSGTTSIWIDSILIREADRENIGIPLTRHEAKTSKIEGAYVHSLEPGLYHWVVVLDFRSMYPSLMIENNICFTTITKDIDGSAPSPENGARFMLKEKKEGLLPRILKGLMNDRMEAKRKMKEAPSVEEREYYNGLQEAIKVLMNSFYGVFASFFYRFTDRSIGSSITAYARDTIMSVIKTLQSEDLKVIYSDTDSIFLKSPAEDLEGSMEFGRTLAKRFSEGATVLEFEKVFRSFFSHGKKKRYVGKLAGQNDDLVIRGYEMRRTDSFDLQSEALTKVFEMVLENDMKGALDYSRNVIKDMRSGKVDLDKLVISRSVQEVEEDKISQSYKNPDSMANVQALRKTRNLGIEMVPGMKVSWIVVDGRSKPQTVEPFIDGRAFNHSPDLNYYAERLSSTLSRVTEVFGVSEKELLTGASQSSLLDSFEPTEEDGEEGEEAVSGKKLHENGKGPSTEGKKASTMRLDEFM